MKKKAKKYKIPIIWLDGKPTISKQVLLIYFSNLAKIKNTKSLAES